MLLVVMVTPHQQLAGPQTVGWLVSYVVSFRANYKESKEGASSSSSSSSLPLYACKVTTRLLPLVLTRDLGLTLWKLADRNGGGSHENGRRYVDLRES